ncbi:MAG: ImmA/IrrE family metallo-endopeptidase [Mycobacterium leprae]
MRPAEQEAERVLLVACEEVTALGEPWDHYRIDVELVAGLLFGLGVQRVADLQIGERSYAGFLDASSHLIAVESNHHDHRQRFSIAHEIGHYVLHCRQSANSSTLFVCTTGDMEIRGTAVVPDERKLHTQQEWEANLFAGALLMPEPAVRAMHRVTGGKVSALVKHFNVSPQAMEIRLEGLRLARR